MYKVYMNVDYIKSSRPNFNITIDKLITGKNDQRKHTKQQKENKHKS